jgi:two-component system, OmpR family, phosphate regulon sensor histidine kinase PhoR
MEKQLATLRAVVDGMAEGVWITGDDGTIIQHNNAIKEMLYAGQQIMGQRPASLLRSNDLQLAVERACREGVSTRLELPIDGVRPRVVSIHISPLGRELAGSAAVFFDVTELRRLEKIRKDFVANVSHELRTPITAIRGYAETLKSGALEDALNAPRMVDIIYRQSERLSELVEDLLELSRIDARQIQLQEKPIGLEKATLRAAETVRPKALTKQIAVEVAIAPGLQVVADERALDQVLLNLLDNAVKYTPSGGHVRVTAKDFASTVELSVKDNGAGIEARHLPRIFERFYRVDKGRSRDMGGTGLGLSIVKNLVTLMKGDVRVHSAPAEGSTFFVTLPRPGAAVSLPPVLGDEAPKVQMAE